MTLGFETLNLKFSEFEIMRTDRCQIEILLVLVFRHPRPRYFPVPFPLATLNQTAFQTNTVAAEKPNRGKMQKSTENDDD